MFMLSIKTYVCVYAFHYLISSRLFLRWFVFATAHMRQGHMLTRVDVGSVECLSLLESPIRCS